MPLPRALAALNRRAFNRVTGPLAGHTPFLSVVIHKGRNSGREYRVPVNASRHGDVIRISLAYGKDSDWVRNVVAADAFELDHRGRHLQLVDVRVRNDPAADWAPPGIRHLYRLIGAVDYLEGRVVSP